MQYTNHKIKVTCFGAGFVGLPTSSVLALMNPQVDFVVFDIDEKRVQMIRQYRMPIYEPNLLETFKEVYGKNLTVTSQISEALNKTDVIFLALPTPTKTFGLNAYKAYDMSYTEKAVRNIAQYYNKNATKMKDNVIIVQKSTVPIGTAKVLNKLLSEVSLPENKHKYIITSNPEFLAQGTAINDIKLPSRVLIGLFDPSSNIENLKLLYNYVADRVIFVNSASSELSKLASNCFLAQRVSSINSIAMICEEFDADITEVRRNLQTDDRIGSKFLQSGPGFGGSCFEKDILALIYLSEQKGLTQVANYWRSVIELNNYQKSRIFCRIYHLLNSSIKGKIVAILGLAFKKGTNDARQSPAINICRDLLIEGAILNVVDPQTTRQYFISQMKYKNAWDQMFSDRLVHYASAPQAVKNSNAIVLITQWDEFKTLPFKEMFESMQRPSWVFDTRLILNEQELTKIGYNYVRVGKKYAGEQFI